MVRHRVIACGLAAVVGTLIAAQGCNAINGLSDLKNVACVGDCGATVADTQGETSPADAIVDTMKPDVGPATCLSAPDPENPKMRCGPEDLGEKPCADASTTCPSAGDSGVRCMAPIAHAMGAEKFNYRASYFRYWAPKGLVTLAPMVIGPQVNAKCNGGTEQFNTLMTFDTKTKTMTIGSSKPSSDGGKTFSFVNETITQSQFITECPEFGPSDGGPPAAIDQKVEPVNAKFNISLANAQTETIPQLRFASYEIGVAIPTIIPLSEVNMKMVFSPPEQNCIGEWNPLYACNGPTASGPGSLGFTTNGQLVGKLGLEDADRIPLKNAGCQSICAIFVGDPGLTSGGRCKRGADGKIPEIGDSCIGGVGCKNAILYSATFAAYAVDIK